MADRIQLRRGTAAQWAANQDKVLLSGEPAAELDQSNKIKIGDGVTPWSQLGYVGGSTNASDIISGTLNDARLSANVPLKNAENTFTEKQTIKGVINSSLVTTLPQGPASYTTQQKETFWNGWQFRSNGGDPSFDSVYPNNIASFGWNTDGTVHSEPRWNVFFESAYRPGNGVPEFFELNFDFVLQDATTFRQLSMQMPRVSNASATKDRVSTSFWGNRFNIGSWDSSVSDSPQEYQFDFRESDNFFVVGADNLQTSYIQLKTISKSALKQWIGGSDYKDLPYVMSANVGFGSEWLTTFGTDKFAAISDNNTFSTVLDAVNSQANIFVNGSSCSQRFGSFTGLNIWDVSGPIWCRDASDSSLWLRYDSEGTRIGRSGSGLSFFQASPASKQTVSGSRGGNAAVASLLTSLSNYGLITDSTTAGELSASDITTGTLADARLSANVPLKNAATEFTNTFTFAGMAWRESNATPAYNDYWRGWISSFSGINAPHSNNDDTVLRFGFNIDSGGARINTSDACFSDAIESEYWTAGGTNVLERHWEGVTKQGTAFRVLSALIPKNDADRSVSEISSATDRFVMYDWAKNSRAVFNFTNASVNVLSWEKSTVLQFKKNNSYLYQQLNQAENAYINGPFLNTHNVWQSVVKQVVANTDSAHDPGNALLAVRRFGNGTANEITLDVSIENANNPNLWIGQKWSGVCHGGLEPLIENLSDQSTGLASLRIKTADGGGDARLVLNTIANTIGLGVDASESAFVISKSASLGTSNVFTVNLSTNLATLANGLHLGTRLGLGSATTPTNYIESVSDGVARIVAQNGSTASELRVASIQDAADSFKFTVGGRLHIGTTAGDAGWLGIQNVFTKASAFNDCAINQAANGYTVVNCSSGQALDLRVANSTRLRCNADGVKIITNIGFNDTTPIAKPTVSGSRGGNAALASLLTALANYGLITDSTS